MNHLSMLLLWVYTVNYCKHEQLQVFYFRRDKSGASYVAQGLKLITTLHGEVMGTFSLNSFHIKYIVWVGFLQFRKLREKKKKTCLVLYWSLI